MSTATSLTPAVSTPITASFSSRPASASNPASSTTKVSSKPTSSSNRPVAIGAGVGVPLGVLLLSGLAFLLYRERKQRLHAQKVTDAIYAAMKEKEARGIYQVYEMSKRAGRQALVYEQKRPGELNGRSSIVYEAEGQP